MSKRNPKDILGDIEESDVDDEVERVLALSPEERRRELEAGGVDLKSLRAQADALHAQVQRAAAMGTRLGRPGAPPASQRRRRATVWAISLLAAALAVMLFFVSPRSEVTGTGRAGAAAALRNAAYGDCDAHRWRECEQKLNDAKDLDPDGESEPRVVAARRASREGMVGE